MRTHIALLSLLGLTACATLTAESDQTITVVTKPAGASCVLTNNVGAWNVAQTPAPANVTRSFSPLLIACKKSGLTGNQTLQPQTRNRAYGNILLLGVPAVVDAGTGKGYEYAPETATIALK